MKDPANDLQKEEGYILRGLIARHSLQNDPKETKEEVA